MLSRRGLHVVHSLCKTSPNVARNVSSLSKFTSSRSLRLKNARILATLHRFNSLSENSPFRSSTRYSSTNIVKSPYEHMKASDLLLHEFVWENYGKWPDKVAIECGLTGRSYTFSQLREHCLKFAAALLKSGLKPGQVIALILPNTPDYPIAALGAIEAGLTVSTVNPAYTAGDVHQDVLPAILPFFHIYGFVIIMMSSLRHGGRLVTLPRFEPNSFIKVLETHKTSILYVVPPLIIFLGQHQGLNHKMFERLRIAQSAAAPLGDSDTKLFMKYFPKDVSFVQAYGLTETSPVCLLPKNTNKNLSTVGAPTSLTQAKVIDTTTGKALGPNEHGEICIHGPQVMQGYLNNPKATEETIRDGWLHTGDIGYYDQDGLFYIVDRLKELIKVKGFQVAPAELEELLRTHPKVSDVAVIGVPDARSGEVPVAYIIRKEEVTEEELKNFISGKVAPYKQLSSIIFTESIPKSPAGKILRRFIKSAHLQQHKK